MSSVVISGDTSGSVTLQAPAVAGTTVLTLPATSGTVITGPGGVTAVTAGGTGASTLTANNVILGNGTSAVQFVAPGSNGNVLTSNGTTWTSAAAGGGQLQTQLFTAPGTWTKPASCTQVQVTVIAGGSSGPGFPGAAGFATAIVPVSAPVTVTVGTGGAGSPVNAPGAVGGTSSFGPAVSATGGAANSGVPTGSNANGTGTVSVGTALRTGSLALIGLNTPASWPTDESTTEGRGYGAYLSLSGFSVGTSPSPTPTSYSTSGASFAGAKGRNPANGNPSFGAVNGAVLVEFVG